MTRSSALMRIQQMNKQSDRRDESNDKLKQIFLEQLGIQRQSCWHRVRITMQCTLILRLYGVVRLASRSWCLPPPHHSKYGKDADEDADLFQQDSDKEEDLVERLSQTGEQN